MTFKYKNIALEIQTTMASLEVRLWYNLHMNIYYPLFYIQLAHFGISLWNYIFDVYESVGIVGKGQLTSGRPCDARRVERRFWMAHNMTRFSTSLSYPFSFWLYFNCHSLQITHIRRNIANCNASWLRYIDKISLTNRQRLIRYLYLRIMSSNYTAKSNFVCVKRRCSNVDYEKVYLGYAKILLLKIRNN